ncbi:PREDICTED: H/ACA ribonucleoprotein complex subunit 1-like [Elephantulus edwardii]|uniref:H/ACA ribonucleoprotein complex subunit 1-like n=1 Tax=Elephantulus edwardii TaxID=28737 RepID=UPI0003F0ADB3|nr:PREDICTED: H/ACA ribonucleoprotein complex subunit 1-like [Elephantulus edwardii]
MLGLGKATPAPPPFIRDALRSQWRFPTSPSLGNSLFSGKGDPIPSLHPRSPRPSPPPAPALTFGAGRGQSGRGPGTVRASGAGEGAAEWGALRGDQLRLLKGPGGESARDEPAGLCSRAGASGHSIGTTHPCEEGSRQQSLPD